MKTFGLKVFGPKLKPDNFVLNLQGLNKSMVKLAGWRRAGLALVLGLSAALALTPLHLVFLLVPAFTGLVWLIDAGADVPDSQKGGRAMFAHPAFRAFAIAWWFGVGFFTGGMHWVALAFLVDANQFAWMIPFVLFGLSAGLALFSALAGLLTFLSLPMGPGRPFALAIWWIIFEWVRGWIFTGFPWNRIGEVWGFSGEIIQFTSLFGVLGLGLVTVLLAALPALFVYGQFGFRRAWAVNGLGLGLLVLLWAGGAWRLAGAVDENVPGVGLRLVQPNIAQRDKWVPRLRRRHLQQLGRMSQASRAGGPPSHIIWPETALPMFLDEKTALRIGLGNLVRPGGALITGAPRRSAAGPRRVWNSMFVIGVGGRILDSYDKVHLVPFGEYVPFRKYLSFSKITAGRSDFTPGPLRGPLKVPGAPPVSPLICYEAIFSGQVVSGPKGSEPRPGWLLNLTNDAWFGLSAGPHQHFANVRLRAVEEGLPLVRVANTGISGVVDAHGRIRAKSPLGEKAIIDADLPAALAGKTIYSRIGLWGMVILTLIFWGLGWRLSLYSVSPAPA